MTLICSIRPYPTPVLLAIILASYASASAAISVQWTRRENLHDMKANTTMATNPSSLMVNNAGDVIAYVGYVKMKGVFDCATLAEFYERSDAIF